MGSDSLERDSHRKHRRSISDEEADKPSKRHKHRHHHHRRHRHHRSRKDEEEKDNGGDDMTAPVPKYSLAGNGGHIGNDDVEEGEILDEENFETKKLDTGESGAVDHRYGAETRNPGVEVDIGKEDIRNKTDETLVTDSMISGKMHNKHYDNGVLHHEFRKEDDRRKRESRSPSTRSGKQKTYPDVDAMEHDESKSSDRRKSFSSESSGDRHKRIAGSPSRVRVHNRSRSRSRDPARVRSRSRSVIEDEAYLRRRHRSEQHSSRDFPRDDGREHRAGYSSRYSGRGERHRSRETRDRETSREREIEKEQRRGMEQESSKDVDMDRNHRRDKLRELSKDRETYRGMEDRDRRRYEEGDGGRMRVKERGRSRDRGRMSDRDIDRQRERERDRDRDRDRDRVRDRESEKRSDRIRDNVRHHESERKKYGNLDDGYDNRDWHKYSRISTHDDDTDHYRDRIRRNDYSKAHGSDSYSLEDEDKKSRDEVEQNEFEERVALQLVDQEEEELNRIKEESRKRRQAILEKYKKQPLQQQNESRVANDEKPSGQQVLSTGAAGNHADKLDVKGQGVDVEAKDQLQSVRKSPSRDKNATSDWASGPVGLGEGSPKSETSDHIFCDDIFGETPTGVRKSGKAEGVKIVRSGLHDNWDDAEGYYSYRFGEILDGRYEVIAAHGKGVFSTVVRAKDLKAGHGEPEEVAIKIIRNNETMNKAGQTEVQILKKLAGADPENKRHCVRFISSFKYRNHLCLVFESLNMNLREVLKKFGRNIGLKLTAVRAYSKQLFISLKHLRNCGVLHCDIKPDNMLVNEAKNVLKLCDFGNAMFAGKNEITPYLVSRFYRAPEIILGLPYDHPLDIWSVGCCLYELYTGKVLFPGATNNDMLRLHMELKGLFPKKMLRKGAFTDQHFDQDLNFHATEDDPVTKKTIKRMIVNIKPKDIGSIITNSPGEDPKMLANFKDLLEKIFVLDPEKRMTVAQALTHPFISGK